MFCSMRDGCDTPGQRIVVDKGDEAFLEQPSRMQPLHTHPRPYLKIPKVQRFGTWGVSQLL
jgi:hypothetical protein